MLNSSNTAMEGEAEIRLPFQRHSFNADILKQLLSLRKLDNWHWLLAVVEDSAMIALAYWIGSQNFATYLLAIFIIGSRQRALTTLLHESAHRTLARNPHLNYVVALLAGYSVGQIPTVYRQSHISKHHGKFVTSDDVDLIFHKNQGLCDRQSPAKFFLSYVVAPILLMKVPNTLRYICRDRFFTPLSDSSSMKPKLRRQMKLELIGFVIVWIVVLTILIATGQGQTFLLYWTVPFLTTFPIVNWFCELSEHYPLPDLHTCDIYLSRNRLGAWYEHLFFSMHKENYHLEHHLDPKIPYWNLTAARKIRLQDSTYAAIDAETGGLFTKGRNGASSAISKMIDYHRRKSS